MAPITEALTVLLQGHGAPPVARVQSCTLDGLILRVALPVRPETVLFADLRHPGLTVPRVTGSARVLWCRPVPQSPQPFAGIEFMGSWGELVGLRRGLSSVLGHRVLLQGRVLGYVLDELGTHSCYDTQTVKTAAVTREGPQFVLRSLRGSERHPTLVHALQAAFGARAPLIFDPPLPKQEMPISNSPSDTLGMETLEADTLVLKPEDDPFDSAIFGAQTIVLKPNAPELDPVAQVADDGGEETVVLPGKKMRRGKRGKRLKDASRVLDDGKQVGFICPSTVAGSWALYDLKGDKIGMISAEEEDCYRIVSMGSDSLMFLEAETCIGAVTMAFGLTHSPEVNPPLPGVI